MARYVGVYLHLKFSDCELEALVTKEIQRRQSWGSTEAQVHLEAAELTQNITQHAVCCPSLHLQSRHLIPFHQYSYRVAFSSDSIAHPNRPSFPGLHHTTSANTEVVNRKVFANSSFLSVWYFSTLS